MSQARQGVGFDDQSNDDFAGWSLHVRNRSASEWLIRAHNTRVHFKVASRGAGESRMWYGQDSGREALPHNGIRWFHQRGGRERP